MKNGMQSGENAVKPQGILSPECCSGGKERKLLSVFWLGLIQLVFDKIFLTFITTVADHLKLESSHTNSVHYAMTTSCIESI